MICPWGAVRVMVATKPVDFRKGMEALATVVCKCMGADTLGRPPSSDVDPEFGTND